MAEYLTKDLEDLLIEDLVLGIPSYPATEPMLHTAIYNTSAPMKRLAYSYGFSVGKEISVISGGKGILHLLNVLDNSGIGRKLYMPAGDVAIIKSSTKTGHRLQTGAMMHNYEAGLISGYLSAYTSKTINTIETHCRYSGAEFCQFVSNDQDQEQPDGAQAAVPPMGKMVEMVRDSSGAPQGKAKSYFLLSILPVLGKQLISESAGLMLALGERLAVSEPRLQRTEALARLASFFDISHQVREKEGAITVTLKYLPYNSTSGFVELSTKAFIGFLSKSFKSSVRLSKAARDNVYTVRMSTKSGV